MEQLRSKLRECKLPSGGSKAILISRLTQYAQDKSQWVKYVRSRIYDVKMRY